MNAIQPSRPPLKPPVRRTSPAKSRPSVHRVVALETTVKLVINILLSAVALSGTVQLLRYQWLQQEKLREIQTEVSSTQKRVDRLQTDFNRYFDPQQAKSIMQEQSNRVAAGQQRIILLDKSKKPTSSGN